MTTSTADDDDAPRRTRPRADSDDDEIHDGEDENGAGSGEDADGAAGNKRRRLGQQRFPPGAIMRVTLQNFVTYTAAEFFPGPNMNLVIGPNGSGKSTIVCAICLGLGYKPDVLGRAAQISEFVQHGKDVAEIEIELAEKDDNSVVIKRKLNRDNKSQYWINGKQSTHTKVQELMTEMKIQCDNLCQFLPQDKVASFAAITPTQLLRETQRAVGGEDMVNHWKRLINLRTEERDLQLKYDNDKEKLQSLNKKQEADRVDVERYRQQENLSTHIEDLKIRIPFAKFRVARAAATEKKEALQEAKKHVRELEERDAPMHKRVKDYEARKAEFDRRNEARKTAFERVLRAITAEGKQAAGFDAKANELRAKMTRIRKAKADRAGKIRAKEKDLEKDERHLARSEKEFNNLPENWDADLRAEVEEAGERRKVARQAFNTVASEVDELQANLANLEERLSDKKKELVSLSSTFQQRLKSLKESRDIQERDTAAVAEWLELGGGKNRFDGTIHLPPCLTVGVTDPKYANLAEGCFQRSELMGFTCSTREDYTKFCSLVLDNSEGIFHKGHLLRVSEHSGGKQLADWKSPMSQDEIRRLGFDFYLKDILTGPDDVLNSLCTSNHIYALPLALRELNNDVHERLKTSMNPDNPEQLMFGKYVCAQTRFNLTRERYGNRNTVVMSTKWNTQATFFATKVNSEQTETLQRLLQHLKRDIDDLKRKLSAEQDNYDRAEHEKHRAEELVATIMKNRAHYNQIIQNREKALGTVETTKSALQTIKDTPDRSEAEMAKVRETQKSDARNHAEISIRMAELVKEGSAGMKNVVVMHMKATQATADSLAATAEAGQISVELVHAKTEFGRLYAEYETAKRQVKAIIEEAGRLLETMGRSSEDSEQYMRETATVEELEDELENAEKTLELQQRHNVHGLLEAYEKRALEIDETQTRMADRQEEIETLSGRITEFRQVWEPRLQILVTRVSDKFGEAFASIGCAGEVSLRKGGNAEHETDDFETWSIEIKVKFRETEQLQALTGQTQSGGERSVSTIFYLLALQELAKSPFRVVDEINQGMDPRNERLVHSRLVDAACRPGTSQYFLITPKLLPGLKYHRNMKILTINNGKFIPGALDIASVLEQEYQLQQD